MDSSVCSRPHGLPSIVVAVLGGWLALASCVRHEFVRLTAHAGTQGIAMSAETS